MLSKLDDTELGFHVFRLGEIYTRREFGNRDISILSSEFHPVRRPQSLV